ncbi:hypothetical protein TIFTF001_034261 [Ficus carica]|uniref:CCHC-type domain-containing protein n=1 Tax=Ficus carica TaxID=3494 RepID=A0AA88DZZ2_FICCA|nr:hypothetical protein TIFTF001_034261 [Ficus carica]
MEAQQDEFNSFRQRNLSVAEAVKKFKQLARLCPHLISFERDKVRRMMMMFHSDLEVVISSGPYPLTIVAECVSQAIRAEYWVTKNNGLSSLRLRRKRRPKLSRIRKDQIKFPSKEIPTCQKCGKKHLGDCRAGTNSCFLCGKDDHYAKNCNSNSQNLQNHQRGQGYQLHAA